MVQGSGQGNERNNETVQEMKLFKVCRRPQLHAEPFLQSRALAGYSFTADLAWQA